MLSGKAIIVFMWSSFKGFLLSDQIIPHPLHSLREPSFNQLLYKKKFVNTVDVNSETICKRTFHSYNPKDLFPNFPTPYEIAAFFIFR